MKLLCTLLILLVAAALALAQPSTQEQLLAIDSAFVKGHYAEVELLTLRILQGHPELTPQERSRVNVTAGYALIMQGREQEARDYFRRALDVEPNLTLDPVLVSPKFRVVFDEVKAGYKQPEPNAQGRTNGPLPLYRLPSRQALFSNLLLPGSGQWQEGHPLRGGFFLLAQAASVVAFVSELQQARDAHEDYLAETDPARMADAYDSYNRHYQRSWGAGALMGLVYVAAQADLVLRHEPVQEISFYPVFHQNPGIGVTVRW